MYTYVQCGQYRSLILYWLASKIAGLFTIFYYYRRQFILSMIPYGSHHQSHRYSQHYISCVVGCLVRSWRTLCLARTRSSRSSATTVLKNTARALSTSRTSASHRTRPTNCWRRLPNCTERTGLVLILRYLLPHVETRGCGRWGAARYGAVLAVEYVRAVLRLSRSVQGGKLSLIHIWRCRRIERCRSRWSPYH